jgi:hypothetical protein
MALTSRRAIPMAETTIEMRGELERRVDALETEIAAQKTSYEREIAECWTAWVKLAGRTLGYAGVWKRQHIVKMSMNTIARALDVPVELVEPNISCIAAAIPDGAGKWSNGMLTMTFQRFAKDGDAQFEERDVLEIFERWKDAFCKPKAKLYASARFAIESRLAEGVPKAQILLAIRGICSSSWHHKKNHTSLELICRSAQYVEKYARWATHGLPDIIRPEEEDVSMLGRIGGKT